MATDIERMQVRLEASIAQFDRQMAMAARVTDRQMAAVERRTEAMTARVNATMERAGRDSVARIDSLMGQASSALATRLSQLGGLVGTYLSVDQLRKYADAWQEAGNQIRAAGRDDGQVADRQRELADVAVRSRAAFGSTAELYAGLARSTRDLDLSTGDLVGITETIAKAFTAGGVSAATADGAIRQLSQGLAAGALRGDEFNSVAEGAPMILDLVAARLGVTRGELRKLAEDGKITSQVLIESLTRGRAEVERQFQSTVPTIGQALQNIQTSLTRYFGEMLNGSQAMANASGPAQQFAATLNEIARNGDVAGGVLATLAVGLSTLLATSNPVLAGIAAAATAFALFGDKVRPIAGDLASLFDYAAVGFGLVRQAGADAAAGISAAWVQVSEAIASALSSGGADGVSALALVVGAVRAIVNAIIGIFVFAGETISATWSTLGQAMAGAVIEGANAAIVAVELMVNRVVAGINTLIDGVNLLGAGMSRIGDVRLPKIEHGFAGAGRAAGEAYGRAFQALTRDYIGDSIGAIDGALARLRQLANERASGRLANEAERANAQGSNGPPRNNGGGRTSNATGGGSGGRGGGGSGAERQNEFERAVADIEKRIAAQQREREQVGLATEAVAKLREEHKLLDAAKAAGIPVTDELRAKISELAGTYASVESATRAAQEQQQAFVEIQRVIGREVSSFVSDLIAGGKSAERAIERMTKRLADMALQAALLGEGPLARLFGGGGGGGIIGLLFGGLFGGRGATAAPTSLIPSFDVGTSNVPRDMLAQVHQGEMIIPRYDAEQIRKARAGGGAAGPTVVNIAIDGGAGDEHMRALVAQGVAQGLRAVPEITRATVRTDLSRGVRYA